MCISFLEHVSGDGDDNDNGAYLLKGLLYKGFIEVYACYLFYSLKLCYEVATMISSDLKKRKVKLRDI